MLRGVVAMVVAAARLALAAGQRLDRLALPEPGAVDDHQLPERRRDRLVCLESHSSSPVLQARGHVDLVTLDQRDDRFLPVAAHTRPALEELLLALHVDRVLRLVL